MLHALNLLRIKAQYEIVTQLMHFPQRARKYIENQKLVEQKLTQKWSRKICLRVNS